METQVSDNWDSFLPISDSLHIFGGLATSHAKQGGHIGRSIATLIEAKDYAALIAFKLDLGADWDALQLYHCRQALAFYTKLEDLDIGIDREAVAYSSFLTAEAACKVTNELFRKVRSGSLSLIPADCRVLYAAVGKIRQILGPCPKISDLTLRFGPGATTALKKREACPSEKMAKGLQCSTNLFYSGLLPSVLRELPAWLECLGTSEWSIDADDYVVEWSPVGLHPGRLEFVPKNAKTHRAIVVEPILNGMLQNGIGDYMARRLKRNGIDIRDQTLNKGLARVGSINGSLATLDLSSASDTIARELVAFLLPEDWFVLLNAARTPSVSYKGTERTQEKFSSMGNGFTFPLETLIFWALTWAACNVGKTTYHVGSIGVYGDDIICPVTRVHDVIRILTVSGFSVGTEKSFWKGPFRESCGGDYYNGISIRPHYQKHLASGESLFVLHNFYFRQMMFDEAEAVRRHIPRSLRLYGPDGYGDGHLVSDTFPQLRYPKTVAKGYAGYSFETFTKVARKHVSRYPGDFVSPLYSIYTKDRERVLPALQPINEAKFGDLTVSTKVNFAKDGRPFWTYPGAESYKRIEIYTL